MHAELPRNVKPLDVYVQQSSSFPSELDGAVECRRGNCLPFTKDFSTNMKRIIPFVLFFFFVLPGAEGWGKGLTVVLAPPGTLRDFQGIEIPASCRASWGFFNTQLGEEEPGRIRRILFSGNWDESPDRILDLLRARGVEVESVTIPSGSASDSPLDSPAESLNMIPAGGKEGAWVRVVDCSGAGLDQARTDSLSKNPLFPQVVKVAARRMKPGDALILFSPSPPIPLFEKGLSLSPILFLRSSEDATEKDFSISMGRLQGGGEVAAAEEEMLLTSNTTRIKGIVGHWDFPPTLLAFFHLQRERALLGSPISFTPVPFNPLHPGLKGKGFPYLQHLERRVTRHNQVRRPFLIVLSLITGGVLLGSSFLPVPKPLLSLMAGLPISFLLPSFLDPPISLVAGMVAALLLWAVITRLKGSPLFSLLLVTVLILLLDGLFGFPLSRLSLLSYTLKDGVRYYGIGNEFLGIFLGSGVLASSLWLERKWHSSWLLLISLVSLVVISSPFLGANVGGGILLVFLFFFFLTGRAGKGNLTRRILWLLLPSLSFVILLGIFDLSLGVERQAHFGRVLRMAREGGGGIFGEVLLRKFLLNWELAFSADGLFLIFFLLTFFLAYYLKLRKIWRVRLSDLSFLGVDACLAGMILSFFVKDTALVTCAMIFPYLVPFLAESGCLPLGRGTGAEKVTGERSGGEQASYGNGGRSPQTRTLLFLVRPARGGQRSHLLSLISHLDPQQWEWIVCAPEGFPIPPSLLGKGEIRFYPAFMADLSLAWLLVQLLHGRRVDLLHLHGHRTVLACLLAFLLTPLPPLVVTVHNPPLSPFPLSSQMVRLFYRLLSRKIRFLCSVSGSLAREWGKLFPQEKISLIPQAINCVARELPEEELERQKQAMRQSWDLPPDAFLVGFLGRVEAEKGVETIIKAAKILKDHPEGRGIAFLLAGEGSLRERITRGVSESGLQNRVKWVGWQESSSFLPLLDLLLLPSLREGMPVALLEAMSLGVPVIASKISGVVEIVREMETGILIPPGDAAALAEKILLLLSSDPMRSSLGEAGREEVRRRFPPGALSLKMQEIYERAFKTEEKN